MNRWNAALAGMVALGLCACGARAIRQPVVLVDEVVMKIGDDPSWARPDLDETGWETIRFDDAPQVDSVLWLRARIDLEPRHLERRPLGIFLAALASHEVWWDGEMIGRGGTVGRGPEEERPGPIQIIHAVPDRLATPGEHRIAIRASAFHRHFHPENGYWILLAGPYGAMLGIWTRTTQVALIGLSGIVMMALFAIMMYAQDPRERSFLFLGLLCLTAAALLVAESWRNLFGYTYNWHFLRLVTITALCWMLDLLLMVFLVRHLPMPGGRWFLAASLAAATLPLVLSDSWDPKAIFGLMAVLGLATIWCLRAVLKRLAGSLLALTGVAVCFGAILLEPGLFIDRNLYLALDVMLLCLLGSHVLQVRRARKEREAVLVKSARLELELIRKHIQPHFLLNTLNALTEWIEREPRVAVGMIQSLAEEFRVLSDISSRPLIRMEEEIRLCRTHLEIMGRRKGREYTMRTDGVDPEAGIPPAVIHTLVENAVTHGRHTGDRVELRLTEDRADGRRRYTFSSPDGSLAGRGASEGTGLRYIRARLQESFGDRWSLESRGDGSRWITEILVPERI